MRGIKKINQETAVHGACMPKDTIVIQSTVDTYSVPENFGALHQGFELPTLSHKLDPSLHYQANATHGIKKINQETTVHSACMP